MRVAARACTALPPTTHRGRRSDGFLAHDRQVQALAFVLASAVEHLSWRTHMNMNESVNAMRVMECVTVTSTRTSTSTSTSTTTHGHQHQHQHHQHATSTCRTHPVRHHGLRAVWSDVGVFLHVVAQPEGRRLVRRRGLVDRHGWGAFLREQVDCLREELVDVPACVCVCVRVLCAYVRETPVHSRTGDS
jgi:hypothetical protein